MDSTKPIMNILAFNVAYLTVIFSPESGAITIVTSKRYIKLKGMHSNFSHLCFFFYLFYQKCYISLKFLNKKCFALSKNFSMIIDSLSIKKELIKKKYLNKTM